MLDSLSKRERLAVALYDEMVRRGDFMDHPVWVDSFTGQVFWDFGEEDEVVDIGCRIGRFVPLLPDLGVYKYFGIDPSKESIEYCKRTFSDLEYCKPQFEVSEMRLLGDKYPARFSGFLLAAVLMHIPRSDLGVALTSIRKCLKDGAAGFFSTPQGPGEEGELEWTNSQGIEISLYTRAELVISFEAAGFQFEKIRVGESMILGHVVAV